MKVTEFQMLESTEYLPWFHSFHACWACGYRQRQLDRHHIVKRLRSWELCNLALFCRRCHGAVEGERNFYNGTLWPKIGLDHVLWMKWELDPLNYDIERLTELRGMSMPEPEPLPDFYMRRR